MLLNGTFQILRYGVTVQSTITKGHINNIDTSAAEKLKGVIGVMTYKNAPRLHTAFKRRRPW